MTHFEILVSFQPQTLDLDAEHYAAQKASTMTEHKLQISQSEKTTVLPISTSCVCTPIRGLILSPFNRSSQSASRTKRTSEGASVLTSSPYLILAKNREKRDRKK